MKQRQGEFARFWPPLIGATLGCTVGVASVFFYSIGLFIRPLSVEFGWSRGGISAAVTAATLALAAASPVAGLLTDRFGARRTAAGSLAILGAGLALLSLSTPSLPLYGAGVILMVVLAAGSTPVVFTQVVCARFVRRRGLALGIAIAGTGIGGAVIPKLLAPFIAVHGWRAGYVALGVTVLIAAPIVAFLIGSRPATNEGPDLSQQAGATLPQALRSTVFWIMAAALGLGALGITSVTVHLAAMLGDAGGQAEQIGLTVSLIGFSIIAGRIMTGLLVDRMAPHWVAVVLYLLGASACLLLASGVGHAKIAAIALGLAMGAEGDLLGFLTARYFGLKAYGAIFGWLYALFSLGAAIGPTIAGVVYDATGGYAPAIVMAAVFLLAAALAAWIMGRFPVGGEA